MIYCDTKLCDYYGTTTAAPLEPEIPTAAPITALPTSTYIFIVVAVVILAVVCVGAIWFFVKRKRQPMNNSNDNSSSVESALED